MEDLDLLLPEIQAGVLPAFERWIATAEPRLRRAVSGFAARVDVEAVVQETLLRIWQCAPRHRPDGTPDSLLRQAVRIARNLCIDEVRRHAPVAVPPAELERLAEGEAVDADHDPLLRRALLHCLELLSGAPAKAMNARLRARGESDDSLAQALDMKVNTFRQNVARARRILTRCLHEQGVRLEEHWR